MANSYIAYQTPKSSLISHPADTFTVRQEIPLGTCEELFAAFFQEPAFKEWHGRHGSWQLRVIGPPGSGKTILSALTVRHLRDHFKKKKKKVGVAAVFVKKRILSGERAFVRDFLTSILTQLSTVSDDSQMSPDEMSPEELHEALEKAISSLERAFLIVDDVDACDHALAIVEKELLHLQEIGLKTMVTSRIPLNYVDDEWACDIEGCEVVAMYAAVPGFWSCRDCYVNDNGWDSEAAQVVCHKCKTEDHPCPECGKHEQLHEPFPCVDVSLTQIIIRNEALFSKYLAEELEITHGDVGLETDIEKPPHSTLGREMSKTSFDAHGVIRNIVDEARFNIAIARVRMAVLQASQTIEELDKRKDRLPDKFLMFFDAGIERVMRQPETERMLGLVTLVIVADEQQKLTFEKLHSQLQDRGLIDNDKGESMHHNLNRVLHATCGFLSLELGKGSFYVEPFHRLFRWYVSQDYNEDLARARSYSVVNATEEGGQAEDSIDQNLPDHDNRRSIVRFDIKASA